jgi:hypothetical protein
MAENSNLHPDSPAGGGGPGGFASAAPTGRNPEMDKWNRPGPLGAGDLPVKLTISGVIAAGGELSKGTIVAVNKAAAATPSKWRRYIAYSSIVKVGGSLAWRANNPGNLRDASSKIGTVSGAVGKFAIFATLEDGRAAQRDLYLTKYGDMKVRDAINKLTPPSENDTAQYLADLKDAGVDLDKDVKSQIDTLMKGVEANEGLIEGTEVTRVP